MRKPTARPPYHYVIAALLFSCVALTALKHLEFFTTQRQAQRRMRQQNNTLLLSQDSGNCQQLSQLTSNVRQCIRQQLQVKNSNPTDFRKQFPSVINRCGEAVNRLGAGFVHSKDGEAKGYVKFSQPLELDSKQQCNVVTVGIGGDITAEQTLRENLNANCAFYGVEPMPDQGKVYESIGKYYETAIVAGNGSTSKVNVLKPDKRKNAVYQRQNVTSTSLLTFIKQTLATNHIDLLWMDVEGEEYNLLPFFEKGGVLESNNISICQLNIETHEPIESFFYGHSIEQWHKIMAAFLLGRSAFLPLYVQEDGHRRIFLVNPESPICVRRYFAHFC